jgi:hypothetical protein
MPKPSETQRRPKPVELANILPWAFVLLDAIHNQRAARRRPATGPKAPVVSYYRCLLPTEPDSPAWPLTGALAAPTIASGPGAFVRVALAGPARIAQHERGSYQTTRNHTRGGSVAGGDADRPADDPGALCPESRHREEADRATAGTQEDRGANHQAHRQARRAARPSP